jgi:hypothetical protein
MALPQAPVFAGIAEARGSMPIRYRIDRKKRLVECVLSGFITADHVLEFDLQIVRDPGFDPAFSQLIDCTAIEGTDVTPARMRVLAEESPFSATSRRALVAESPLGFGLSRVYEIVRSLRGDQHICVFRNRKQALNWLLEEREAA